MKHIGLTNDSDLSVVTSGDILEECNFAQIDRQGAALFQGLENLVFVACNLHNRAIPAGSTCFDCNTAQVIHGETEDVFISQICPRC
jgi:hypothetical protein